MNFNWTSEAKIKLADLLIEGKTARQIGDHFGVSRNAITGLLVRDAELNKIGFARKGKARNGGRTKRFTDEEMIERRRQYNKAYKQKQRYGTNGIPFPTPSRNTPAQSHSIPSLRIVSNNVPLMVEDWLKRHGGARKFDRRESADEYGIIAFLADRGIKASKGRHNWNNKLGSWNVSKGLGRPRVLSWSAVMEMVDDLRMKEGLQPFQMRANMAAAN